MKIECRCGALIIDSTDDLPHKAHLIPDQAWFSTFDAIDDEVIDPLAAGRLDAETGYTRARIILGRSARLIWQCRTCGRLYLDDRDGQLHGFVPEEDRVDRSILGRG